MRKFTLKTEIVSADKSTKVVNKINTVYRKMAKTITRESKIANAAFTRFTKNVGIRSKKMMVGLNNLNARVNRFGRNIGKKLGTLGVAFGLTALIAGLGNTIDKFASFEQANVNLASVMSKTINDTVALQKNAKLLGATTAKTSTEVVGLQEAYARLGFGEQAILDMTESTIAGSIAMRGELSDTAELVGAMVKSFDNFESVNTPNIMDQLTKATQASALNFEKLQTGLPIVAGAANAAKVPFTRLLASMGKLSDAGIDASSSTTALRNIYLEAAKQGVPYETLLNKVKNSTDKLATANELFGKRGAVAAVILAKNTKEVGILDKALQGASGTAGEAAAKQLDTLKGSLTILGSAWEGFILSIEDGNGSISMFLKNTVRVATEMLSLASGTEKAKGELSEAELKIRKFAERGMRLLKLLKLIAIAFIAMKSAIFIYNTAMKGYALATTIATVAAKAWAIAMNLGLWPITAIVAGIALLTIGIIALVRNWKKIVSWVKTSDSAFAKLIRFSIKPIIWMFRLIKEAWVNIKNAFKGGGFMEGIKQIGKSLLSFILAPIEGILRLTNKLTGGRIGGDALKRIESFRDSLNYKGEIVDDGKKETIATKEDNLASAINENNNKIAQNNEELSKNTMAANKEWTGRFKTSILKDANISETSSGLAQKEIATSAISNEENITNIQKDVISSSAPQSVVTQGRTKQKSSKPVNGTITVNVVDNTGGQFALQVEGTGVEVITTGNG